MVFRFEVTVYNGAKKLILTNERETVQIHAVIIYMLFILPTEVYNPALAMVDDHITVRTPFLQHVDSFYQVLSSR
jgi:hypothetical protein